MSYKPVNVIVCAQGLKEARDIPTIDNQCGFTTLIVNKRIPNNDLMQAKGVLYILKLSGEGNVFFWNDPENKHERIPFVAGQIIKVEDRTAFALDGNMTVLIITQRSTPLHLTGCEIV